ncbi:uncharacterized protein LOC143221938 [Lasioglossum baleicum]|uniref:uncharacterized protein LOC143207999 n=1 Tax=Lasioglossum baleicum TaxID=434251 RepID=UPI003FCEE2EC
MVWPCIPQNVTGSLLIFSYGISKYCFIVLAALAEGEESEQRLVKFSKILDLTLAYTLGKMVRPNVLRFGSWYRGSSSLTNSINPLSSTILKVCKSLQTMATARLCNFKIFDCGSSFATVLKVNCLKFI